MLSRPLPILAILCALVIAPVTATYAGEEIFTRIEKSQTINCGYFVWPPYIIKNPNTGEISGINHDVMEAIGRNLGLKVAWTMEVGAGEAGAALDARKIDVMCASLWQNPGRIQTMTLTRPIFYSPTYAFARSDDKRFDGDINKANAQNVKISVIDGDSSYDLAKEKLPRATLVSLPMTASGSEMLLQVVTKKADLVICDESIVNDFAKRNPNTLRKVQKVDAIRTFGELLAVRRGEYHLKNMLDLSILQLADDGTIQDILRKYERLYSAGYSSPAPSFSGKR